MVYCGMSNEVKLSEALSRVLQMDYFELVKDILNQLRLNGAPEHSVIDWMRKNYDVQYDNSGQTLIYLGDGEE